MYKVHSIMPLLPEVSVVREMKGSIILQVTERRWSRPARMNAKLSIFFLLKIALWQASWVNLVSLKMYLINIFHMNCCYVIDDILSPVDSSANIKVRMPFDLLPNKN